MGSFICIIKTAMFHVKHGCLCFFVFIAMQKQISRWADGVQLVLGERERAVNLNYIFIYFI